LYSTSFGLPIFNSSTLNSYGFGFSVGSEFKSQINYVIENDPQFGPTYNWATTNGTSIFDNIIQNHEKFFPAYLDELEGMGDGSGIYFNDLLLENFAGDLANIVSPNLSDSHCSDVLSIQKKQFSHGHNEDADFFWMNNTFMLETENWIAYSYAAQLSGCAFGWTKNGLSISVNSLFPSLTNLNGMGSYFIARDLLNSTDLEDAIFRGTRYSPMSGISINLGSINTMEIVNIEIAPFQNASVTRSKKGVLPHFNQYIYLNVSQLPDQSSVHRMERYETLKPKTYKEIINFLGDTTDSQYPVYRTGNADQTWTLATMVIDFRTVFVFDGNPKTSIPVFTFSL